MTASAAEAPRMPIATGVMTRGARGAGRFTFGFVGLLVLGLKLYEFYIRSEGAFLDPSNPEALGEWVRIGILVFEAIAAAAVVSVAVTYVVVNSSVTNNTSNTSITYNGQDLGQVITVIGSQLQEVRDRIASFEQLLVRTEEAERQRMREFLGFAESERIKQQAAQLEADQRRFDDIAESLKKVIEVLNRP